MSEQRTREQLFFDPFAAEGEALFDPQVAHQAMWEKYAKGEVEHDYTADKFVADTEALMMDAQFVGQFEQAQAIAERMHILCGEDHNLQQSVAANESLSGLLNGDSHNHDTRGHDRAKKRDEKSKKKSKKKKFRGWFSLNRD